MKRIRVHLKDRSYNILIGYGLIKSCGAIIKSLGIGRDAAIITNRTILKIHKKRLERPLKKAGMTARFELVPDSERSKSGAVAMRLVERLSGYDRNKTLFIIAFGGGVVGDVAGFAAAVYKRGIPYIQVPTTLLAQVDSAIGGKVAVDIPAAKNMAGAFYQPRLVLSDTSFLRTLSSRQVRSGLAEIIKYAVIKDKRLFEYLEKNLRKILGLDRKAMEFLVARCSAIKAKIVEEDEFDKKGIRVILNHGHTIGHAIEAASGYSGRYDHGEAIAVGMLCAGRISSKLGFIKESDIHRIEALVKAAGLPTGIRGIRPSSVYEAHLHDKKFIRGKNRFVLPTRIGSVKVAEDIPDSLVKDVIMERIYP